MLITEKPCNVHSDATTGKNIDLLCIEWFEANKRILHKQTQSGRKVTLKFLNENPNFKDGDIIWHDANAFVAIEIIACPCIVIVPGNILAASAVCYEIGNRHLPLFHEKNELLVPFDKPLYNLLKTFGFEMEIADRKLNNGFKTSVLPHVQLAETVRFPAKIPQHSTT